MKKILLNVLLIATGTSLFAQATIGQLPLENSSIAVKPKVTTPKNLDNIKGENPAPYTKAAGDTIWYDNFSTPANWVMTNSSSPNTDWVITNTMPTGLTGQGFAAPNTPSGGNFAIINSDGAGASGTQNANITTANPISCAGIGGVVLNFHNYHRRFQEIHTVYVSNDNVNWVAYPVNEEYAPNTSSPNSEKVSVNISSTAGNQPTVWIRFNYQGAYDWFWVIDDVTLTEPEANDLKLDQVYWYGKSIVSSTEYFSQIPLRHALLDTIFMDGAISNVGSDVQPNMTFGMAVNSSIIGTTTPTALGPGMADTFSIATPYVFNAIGTYTVDFAVASPPLTDANPANNVRQRTVKVSQNVYSRDQDDYQGGGSWWGPNRAYMIGNYFPIYATDTLRSIEAIFQGSTGTNSIVSAHLLDGNFDIVASNQFHQLTAEEIGTPISFYMGDLELQPGDYMFVIENVSGNDSVIIGTDDVALPTPEQVSFVDVDVDGTWGYITFTPMVRAITLSGSDPCHNVVIGMNGTVNDASTTGSITMNSVTGGSPIYSYNWNGPAGSGITNNTQKNLSNLTVQGTYTVEVRDGRGCSATKTFDVAGSVGTEEVVLQASDISIFPNPSNGTFNVTLNNAKGTYTIVATNVLGEEVYTNQINANGGVTTQVELNNVSAGAYFITVKNNTHSYTEKVLVK